MPILYQLTQVEKHRFKYLGLKKTSKYKTRDKVIRPYLKSKMTRYINDVPIIPIGFIKTKTALMKHNGVCKYTEEGRKLIHKRLQVVSVQALQWLRSHPVISERATIEFNDNRISLYVPQQGKCAVTGEELDITQMHCHYKIPWIKSKDERYSNLILTSDTIHRMIHATREDTLLSYMQGFNWSDSQLEKINKLRVAVGNTKISFSNQFKNGLRQT